MKKEDLYSHKPWLILVVVVISMVIITFSSVNAADQDSDSHEIDPWTSSGYKEVTVSIPSEKSPAADPQEECVLNTTDLVSHWPLNEQAGATTFVDVVSSMNGTCQGDACPIRTFGKIGGAYTFVARDKNVISVPAAVNPGKALYDTMANGNFSAGVWVKTTQTCITGEINNKVFFGRYRDVDINGTWWLGCKEPGGLAVFRLRDSGDTVRQIDGTSNITDGHWHYIVGVRDSGSDKNYLYVDGVLEGMLDSPLYSGNFSSDMPITMGAYDEPTPYYLDGTLDEVVLYDRVLAPNEIGTYYDACEAASAFTYIPIVKR